MWTREASKTKLMIFLHLMKGNFALIVYEFLYRLDDHSSFLHVSK